MKKLLLENSEVSIELENGIIIATWKNSLVDINKAKEAVEYRLKSTDNIAYPLLANIRPVKTITKEARDFLASKEGCEGALACALLIDSPLSSMIGNFFISISRPLVPTKIFTNEAEAKKWLTQYVNI